MERNYKVLIIDDEEGAIENLILCLKRYPFLTVEGTAKNGSKHSISRLDAHYSQTYLCAITK